MQRVQDNYGAIFESRAISLPLYYKVSVCFQIQASKHLSAETDDVVMSIAFKWALCCWCVCVCGVCVCVCELDSSMRVSHQTHMVSSSTPVC